MLVSLLAGLASFAPRGDDYVDTFHRAWVALQAGELDRARTSYHEALALRRSAVCAYHLACVEARDGHAATALEWLSRATDWGWCDDAVARWDPDLAAIRGSPEFSAIASRMHARRAPQPARTVGVLSGYASRTAGATCTAFEFDPEPGRCWYALSDGSIRSLELATRRRTAVDVPQAEDAQQLRIAGGDGIAILALSDNSVAFVSLVTGALFATLADGAPEGRAWPGTSLELDPARERVAVWRGSAPLTVHAVSSAERLSTARVPYKSCRAIAWSPDGARIALAIERTVYLIDSTSGELISQTDEVSQSLESIAFAPDGCRIVAGGDDGLLVLWTLDDDVVRSASHDPYVWLWPEEARRGSYDVGSVTFSPDSTLIATGMSSGGWATLWTSELHHRWTYDFGGGAPASLHVAFDRSGRFLTTSGMHWSTGRILDTEAGQPQCSFEPYAISQLELCDDATLAVADREFLLSVFDARSCVHRYDLVFRRDADDVLVTGKGWVEGSSRALRDTAANLLSGPPAGYALDCFAALVVDPKRIEAELAGVDVAVAQCPKPPRIEMPEADVDRRAPSYVPLFRVTGRSDIVRVDASVDGGPYRPIKELERPTAREVQLRESSSLGIEVTHRVFVEPSASRIELRAVGFDGVASEVRAFEWPDAAK